MKSRPGLRILGIVLVVAAAQGFIVLVYQWLEHDRAETKGAFPYERLPSKPTPDLVLLRPDGSRRKLTDLRGKPVLLHFWATWCPPCKEELPGLLELGRELAQNGELQLVAVTMDKDWAALRQFFGGQIPLQVMMDGGAAVDVYGVSTLPDTWLLGADGSVRLRFGGARDWRTRLARKVLRNELMQIAVEHQRR